MDWIKSHYERVLLGLTAICLLICSVLIVLAAQEFPSRFSGMNSSKPADNSIKPLPVGSITTAINLVKDPKRWGAHDGSLLVSRPYVLLDGKLVDPLEGDIDLHPPIKNAWLQKYELEYWDRDIKNRDPDKDHFSNLDEFNAGTDPLDPKSVPRYTSKLRLSKFIAVPFRLIFTSTPDDGTTFTINTKDLRGRTQFLQLGDMINGAPYKLISYDKKSTVKDDLTTDTSELTIQNTETGEKITLVMNKEANDPTSFAEFLYLYDNSTLKVKKNEDLTLAPETDHKYKLIDISEGGAVIKDLKSGEEIKIAPVDR